MDRPAAERRQDLVYRCTSDAEFPADNRPGIDLQPPEFRESRRFGERQVVAKGARPVILGPVFPTL